MSLEITLEFLITSCELGRVGLNCNNPISLIMISTSTVRAVNNIIILANNIGIWCEGGDSISDYFSAPIVAVDVSEADIA